MLCPHAQLQVHFGTLRALATTVLPTIVHPHLPCTPKIPAGAQHAKDIRSILSAVATGRVDVHDAASSIQEISSGLHVRPL